MPATTLPEIIPVFPLTGSLLLPGNLLPLNIFEPRYRNMVADTLEGGQHIGMVQPLTPRQDNWVVNSEDPDPDNPEIYRIGCLGRIEECELQDDGRYLIVLRGISRFHIREELSRPRGYRRVRVDYSEFRRDLDELNVFLNPSQMMRALRAFGDKQRPGVRLRPARRACPASRSSTASPWPSPSARRRNRPCSRRPTRP